MPSAPRIKFCGLTSLDDARLAVAAGAWAIGMVFWEGSPRRCELPEAEQIAAALRRTIEVVGVFHEAPLDEVIAVTEGVGLTMVQLHGSEGPAFCREVQRRCGVKVIKAARVQYAVDVRGLEAFRTDYHLLDSHAVSAPGGTGETWNWDLIASRRSTVPLILAGGLDADNVGAAIAAVKPFAVDVASGTESEPGRKDPAKLLAFAAAVAATAPEPEPEPEAATAPESEPEVEPVLELESEPAAEPEPEVSA